MVDEISLYVMDGSASGLEAVQTARRGVEERSFGFPKFMQIGCRLFVLFCSRLIYRCRIQEARRRE